MRTPLIAALALCAACTSPRGPASPPPAAPTQQQAAPSVPPPPQRPPVRAQLALAAGYKALFSCNGRYAAYRTQGQVEADELAATYPDYAAAFAATPAPAIDDADRSVSVSFAADAPPRIAVWRDHFGCILLPSGAGADHIALIPELDGAAPPPAGPSAEPWPRGDASGPGAPLGAQQKARLDQVFAAAFDSRTYGAGSQTTAVLVASADALLAERYRDDWGPFTAQRTWSVAKSLAVSLIGARSLEKKIVPDQPTGLPEWSAPGDPRGAITLTHLLHMSSGLDSGPSGSRSDAVYFGGALVADHAGRGSLIAPPGARWAYANNDTLQAVRVLAATFPEASDFWKFSRGFLAETGMVRTWLGADWRGDYILSSQVWTTARDLARLGVLYLNDGVVNGKRLLPEGWARFVATPAPAQPPATGADGRPAPGYGAQFWLWGERHGLPAGSYAMHGNRGQYVMIVPARDLVIVRRGFDGPGAGFQIERFTADVLAAIESR